MGRSTILRAMLVLACASACGIFGVEDDDEQTDGDICSSDDECRTGVCTTASLCSHSACNCPSGSCAPDGEETDTCRDGWVCVGYDQIILDPIREFFGGEANDRNGYCIPLCEGGCPEHYACDDGGVHCSPDAYWPYPIPTITWSGAASGELSGRDAMTTVIVEGGSTLVLEGSAESPTNTAITGFSWTTVSGAADYETYMDVEGSPIEITVPTGSGSYRRAELTVTDAQSRSSFISVVFEGCYGPGTACGYEGSGCCTSCDDATSTCR